jgi:hypothetical protein
MRDKISKYGWILMTRMKGDPVSIDAKSEEHLVEITSQLARIVMNWQINL